MNQADVGMAASDCLPDHRATTEPEPDGLPPLDAEQLVALRHRLLHWYAEHRRDLPWRHTRDPYAILVAEVMLQQTQAPRVEPRFQAWLSRFPTLAALAAAPTADVLREWSGLGYNSRAVRLQAIARHVVAAGADTLPSDIDALRALPGIGAYTANAIACFAFGRQVPVVDTNVNRVLHRVLLGPEPLPALTRPRVAWVLAARALPHGLAYDWNQALMDFGSAVCTARRPACATCVLRPICRAAPVIQATLAARDSARARGRSRAVPFSTSNRYFRGQILRVLGRLGHGERIALAALGPAVKPDYSTADRNWLEGLVGALARDGLVTVSARNRHEARPGSTVPVPGTELGHGSIRDASTTYHLDTAERSTADVGHGLEFVSLREG